MKYIEIQRNTKTFLEIQRKISSRFPTYTHHGLDRIENPTYAD